jgi:hypothetical protein
VSVRFLVEFGARAVWHGRVWVGVADVDGYRDGT